MAFSPVPPDADLCARPVASPPDGKSPNFVNPTSLATATIVISVLMTVCALAFVAARVVVNWRKLSWSDYFMMIGMAFDIAFTAGSIAKAKYLRHTWDVPACWFNPTFLKLTFVNQVLGNLAFYFAKSSLFLLYRQFFSVKRSMKISVYIGLVATFLTYFPTTPLLVQYHIPRGGESWLDLLQSDDPPKLIYWGIVQGSLTVALDTYAFVLPLPTLTTLHMSLKTRVQLITVFATASMGVIASVVGLVYRVKLLGQSDPTWQQAALGISLVVENNVAIIVGSMPGFATSVRVCASKSTIIKSLRSKIRRTNSEYSGKNSRSSFGRPGLATFGSPNVQRPGNYELGDPRVTAAQVVPDGHYLSSGNHTAEYHQICAQPNSTDRLV